MTRQEAALYAFNMLQADLVEYPNETIVTTGDVTVTTQGTFSSVRWGSSADEDGNIDSEGGDGYVQFAERYFNKLIKKADTDDFARPATTWVNDGDKIGTYADAADVTYTSNVKLGDIYSDLDMSEKDKNAEVYYNGVEADDVAVSKGNTVKVSSSSANNKLVADGSTVEVFYDEDNNDVTICIIDTYVGTISSKEEKVSDPYVVVNSESLVTEKDASTSVSISGSKARFETIPTTSRKTMWSCSPTPRARTRSSPCEGRVRGGHPRQVHPGQEPELWPIPSTSTPRTLRSPSALRPA